VISNKEDLNIITYLFSLCLEDYIGDLEGLKAMAEVDDELLDSFLNGGFC
jgi:hypothetical protein